MYLVIDFAVVVPKLLYWKNQVYVQIQRSQYKNFNYCLWTECFCNTKVYHYITYQITLSSHYTYLNILYQNTKCCVCHLINVFYHIIDIFITNVVLSFVKYKFSIEPLRLIQFGSCFWSISLIWINSPTIVCVSYYAGSINFCK